MAMVGKNISLIVTSFREIDETAQCFNLNRETWTQGFHRGIGAKETMFLINWKVVEVIWPACAGLLHLSCPSYFIAQEAL